MTTKTEKKGKKPEFTVCREVTNENGEVEQKICGAGWQHKAGLNIKLDSGEIYKIYRRKDAKE